MAELEFYMILAFELVSVFLLLFFLRGFYKLYTIIRPLIDKYVTDSGALKLPSWKQAIGYLIMKAADTVDFGKFFGGFGKGGK